MRRLLLPLALACLTVVGVPASADPGPIERLSDAPAGVQGNHYSYSPGVSADGRYVSFESFADNLDPTMPPSTSSMDIFVRDRLTGVTRQASVDSNEVPGDSYSANAEISGDGRYVVFDSHSRMSPQHTNLGHNVYRRDTVAGVTEVVSLNDAGQDSDTGYYASMGHPQVSADGRWVVWTDEATNLVPDDTNADDWAGVMKGYDCFLRDMVAGTTVRASVTSTGGQIDGPQAGQSFCIGISPSGRYVSFQSYEQVVPGVPRGTTRGYVYDRLTGASSLPHPGANVFVVSWSADDSTWLLQGPAKELVPGDTSTVSVHAVLDRATGAVSPVQRSALFAGSAPRSSSYSGEISADGTTVSYASYADDLVVPDLNMSADVFVTDLATGATTLASEGLPTGAVTGADSLEPQLSADGTYVAWYSYDTTQVLPDTNFATDVFGRVL